MRFTIPIPDPCAVILVGAAGSGKSTFAARNFAPAEILSSDAFRARLGRDEQDQDVTGPAFRALHAALSRRLRDGRTTVVDATNVGRSARRTLVGRAARAGRPAIAVVLDLPLDACQAGNAARTGRTVPAPIVERQWRELRVELARDQPFAGDGFAAVHRLRSRAEVDAADVRRRTGGVGDPTDGSPAAGLPSDP